MFDIVTITTDLGEKFSFDPDVLNKKHRDPQYKIFLEEQLTSQNTTKPQRWIGVDLAADLNVNTKWIEISVDLQAPLDEREVRGWYIVSDNFEGFSFFENSEDTSTRLSSSGNREVFESKAKLRLYVNSTFERTFDYSPPTNIGKDSVNAQYGIDHDKRFYVFRLATVSAQGTANLKTGNWTEEVITREENPQDPNYSYNTGDLYFRIGLNSLDLNASILTLTQPQTDETFDGGEGASIEIPETSLNVDSAYINGFRMDSGHIRHLAYVNLLEGDSASHLSFVTGDFKGLSIDSINTHIKLTNEKTIGTGDTKLVGNLIDFDYDSHPNTNNSIAIASNQSIYNFLDRNNTPGEDSNYWALYNNIDPYDPPQGIDSAVFYISEDGYVKTKNSVEAPLGLITNNYELDSDGLRWRDSNLPRIFFDSDEQAWRIVPDIFGVKDSVAPGEIGARVIGLMGQFLSFDSVSVPEFYDYSLKVGRFIDDSNGLIEEKKVIPPTQFASLDSDGKKRYFGKFEKFSHGLNKNFIGNLSSTSEIPDDEVATNDDLIYPFNDSDVNVLSFNDSTQTLKADFSSSTFAGLFSDQAYESYKLIATITSQDSSDGAGFIVVAAKKISGREHTLSLFRRPKATILQWSTYKNTGQSGISPPGWGAVYNFGQYDEQYLYFDDTTQLKAPPPVLPDFEHQSTSNWLDAGSSIINATKTGNIITAFTSQFGKDIVDQNTVINLDLEELSERQYPFLKVFVNTETKHGFGVDGLNVIFKDIQFEGADKNNNIYDVKNDIIHTYIGELSKKEYKFDSAGYYILDSSQPVSTDYSTGRFFYNQRSKTLYWKDPNNYFKLAESKTENFPKIDAYVELRGTGLNNNSPAYMYIDNEEDYFKIGNPDLLNGYYGHGRGLNLTIFENTGEKVSSTTYDTYGDSTNSTLLANAINDMTSGQIGAITSFDAWITNVNENLKTVAFDQGLMKLYNAPKSPIRNPYAAVFQKTTSETPRAHETSSGDSSDAPFADLTFSIMKNTFHTYGPEQPNSLSAWNGKREAWIDENHNTKINQTLMLTEGRYKGLAWEGTSFTASGINEDSARIYLTSEEDSQRTMVIKVGDNLNDKIALEVPNVDGVLQNGFVNLHAGNLHIVFDQTPQLGGDLDVQEFRIYRDSLSREMLDLGFALGKGSNSVALSARQSIHNFIDNNDNETDNFFGIFSNKNPLLETVSLSDAIFSVLEDGTVNFNFEDAGTAPTQIGGSTGRQSGLTTDDIPEGPSGLNLYFDSARVFLALSADNTNNNSVYDAGGGGIGKITVNQSAKSIEFEGITNTDGLPEGSTNLYFTDERAQDAVGGIMSGDDDISVVYDDGANTIEITSTLTQETVFGLQTKYALSGVGGETNANIRLTVESDGITRTEDVGVTGTDGIVVDGSTANSIVVSAAELQKASTFFSEDASSGVKLVFRESDAVNGTVDDPVTLLGASGVTLTQQNGNEITISTVELQAVGKVTADSSGGNIFIRLNDSSPATGISTISQVELTSSNGVELNVENAGNTNSLINISAAALQITSTLKANTSAPGVNTRIGFSETDANGNTDSQFIEFVGTGGIRVSSIAPADVHDGIITISADSMHHPNTTFIMEAEGTATNTIDLKLLHQGPDSGEDTTVKLVSEDGIELRESDGDVVVGSIVQIEQINNETIDFTTDADAAISFGNTTEFTVNSSTSETIEINHGATGSGADVATSNSGQTVIQNITVDKFGHVQSTSSGTVAGQFLMSAINANNVPVIRLDTQSNGQSGSAEDVEIVGAGAIKLSVSTGGDKLEIRVDSSDFMDISFSDLTDGDASGTTNSNNGFDNSGFTNNHVGHVPIWDGTNFTTRKIDFNGDDIAALDVSSVSRHQVLAYVPPNFPTIGGSNRWKNVDLADLITAIPIGIPSSIDDLSDVDTNTNSPTNGQALVWDGTSKFVPGDVALSSDIPSSIDDLSDVDTSTSAPSNGEALVWNGSNFVPGDVSVSLEMSDLTNVSTSGISSGQALVWNGSEFAPDDVGTTHTAGDGLDLSSSGEFSLDLKSNMGLVIDNDQLSVGTTIKTNNIQAQTTGSSVSLLNSGGDTKFEITNSGSLSLNGNSTGTFTVNSAGDVVADGDISAFSDERLKTNVKTIDNALDLVNKLRGVSFTKNQKSGIGVIAQEMEKVIPEVVNTAEDEIGTKSVAYGNLVGVLIEAIKELSEKVEKLERER